MIYLVYLFMKHFVQLQFQQQIRLMSQQQYLAEIQQIFKSFDIDNSGSIELPELKKVAEALGEKLSQVELRKIVKKLDTNGDGKISLEEFKFWWLHGQKGKLSQLVYLRAKSMKLTNSFLKKFQQAGVDLTKFNKNGKVDRVQVELNFGKPLKKGIKLDLSFCHRGQKFNQKYSILQRLIPNIKKQSVNLCILLPTQQIDKFQQQFNQITKHFLNVLPIPIQNIEDNQFLSVKVHPLKNAVALHLQLRQNLTYIFNDLFNKFDQIDQHLDNQLCFFGQAYVQTNFSISDLMQETNLIETLLKGLSLKVNVQVPSSITKKFREVLEASRQPSDDNFGFLLTVLLKSLKLKIKLNTPQKIQGFFKKLGISELIPQCPSFKNLLQFVSLLMNAQQSKQNLEDPKKYLYEFLKILKTHINSGIQLYIHRKQTLFNVNTDFPGAFKIFQMVYNQI